LCFPTPGGSFSCGGPASGVGGSPRGHLVAKTAGRSGGLRGELSGENTAEAFVLGQGLLGLAMEGKKTHKGRLARAGANS